jgi:hypothetical protein
MFGLMFGRIRGRIACQQGYRRSGVGATIRAQQAWAPDLAPPVRRSTLDYLDKPGNNERLGCDHILASCADGLDARPSFLVNSRNKYMEQTNHGG